VARKRRQTSKPLSPGIITSSNTRSGCSALKVARACTPFSASMVL
jgi:hypothetical protein